MAVTLLCKRINFSISSILVSSCRSTGYIVLIPEIPDDIPENPLSRIESLPEISSLTTEKCVAAIGKHTLDYESGVRQIEEKLKDAGSPPQLFPDVLDPLEVLGAPLDTTWGLVKTLYLTNSKLMPANCYMGIHDRARRARATKFNSLPIYTACKESSVLKDGSYSEEQNRVVSKFLLEGRLNGVELKGDTKINLNEILAKIANERKQFQEKIELSTKKFRHVIKDPNMVRDFPEDLLKSMAADSTQPSRGPWTVTLQPHIYSQFLEFCGDRDLRWNVWQAWVSRGSAHYDGSVETSTNLEEIRFLRKCQAQLLGFESFADMSMQTKMAGSVQAVQSMMNSLLNRAKSAQQKELELLEDFAAERGFEGSFKSWDVPYWKRKQQRTIYRSKLNSEESSDVVNQASGSHPGVDTRSQHDINFAGDIAGSSHFISKLSLGESDWSQTHDDISDYDEEELREYFPFPQVLSGLFSLCENLFGLTIVPQSGVDTWHPDVQYYHISEEGKDTPIAGFYLDPYERAEEKLFVRDDSGWMVALRNKTSLMNTNPLAALVFNFPQPLYGKPSLLPFRDVLLLFRKFGHALQHLLTKTSYAEVSGSSNVEWDAVEVCSHFMTHWLYEPSTLANISSHYESGKPLPDDIVDKLCRVRQHLAGYDLCQELYLSALDLELHTTKEFWLDIVRRLLPQYSSFPLEKIDSHPCAFLPIFTGQWGAAYYCHLWARIVAADAFSAFREVDRRNSAEILEIGRRFRNTILASGGGCHPSKVFRLFRGRDPSPNALLYTLGLKGKQSIIH